MSVRHVQAAVPVGRWVVQQSFKAAFGDFSQDAERQRKASRRDEEDKEEA